MKKLRCKYCKKLFEQRALHQRYCSDSHRIMAFRKSKKAGKQ